MKIYLSIFKHKNHDVLLFKNSIIITRNDWKFWIILLFLHQCLDSFKFCLYILKGEKKKCENRKNRQNFNFKFSVLLKAFQEIICKENILL